MDVSSDVDCLGRGRDNAFGVAVTLDADTAVVGAPGDDHASGTDAGSAYVFVRAGEVWTEQAKLIPSDAAGGDEFGAPVALQGDTVLVASWLDDHAGEVDAGSAYAFVRSGGTWTQQTKLTASDAVSYDYFGTSAALDGTRTVIGSCDEARVGAGAAYVFDLPHCAIGDLNCDGSINNFDIDAFVLALTSADHEPPFDDYDAAYPNCDGMLADANDDGSVNSLDIDAFVILLTN